MLFNFIFCNQFLWNLHAKIGKVILSYFIVVPALLSLSVMERGEGWGDW